MANVNSCYALDAGSGKLLWQFSRPPPPGWSATRLAGKQSQRLHRRRQVFMQTDHAHLLALNRFTGAVLWETEMADCRQNYNATSVAARRRATW